MPYRTSKVSHTERLINHNECVTYTCNIVSKTVKEEKISNQSLPSTKQS